MLKWIACCFALAFTASAHAETLDLTLADSPDPIAAGNTLVYTAVVTNTGPGDAIDTVVALPLVAPSIFSGAVADAGGVCVHYPPLLVVCTWSGATPLGVSRTATISALIPATAPPGTLTASATAYAFNAPQVTAATSTTIIRRRRIPPP